MLPVPLVGEDEHHIAKVPRSMVVNIITPARSRKPSSWCATQLDGSGLGRAAGTARGADRRRQPACRRRARSPHGMLGRQVRLGTARPALRGMPDSAAGPAFATAIGPARLGRGRGPHASPTSTSKPTRPRGLIAPHRQFSSETAPDASESPPLLPATKLPGGATAMTLNLTIPQTQHHRLHARASP